MNRAYNTYVGQFAGDENLASNNTFLGYFAMGNNVSCSENTFFGARVSEGTSIYRNTYIGNNASRYQSGSSDLLIDNSDISRGCLINQKFKHKN